MNVWENYITLNPHGDFDFDVLSPASTYRKNDTHTDWSKIEFHIDLESAIEKDQAPLPQTKDREGYYGENHFSYWCSGLRDVSNLIASVERLKLQPQTYLDFGCSSGRVLRHFAYQHPEIQAYGCDINRAHIEWIQLYLPNRLLVFQNHSIPTLPLPDNSLDMITAYSVFTHIEVFETAWLLELRRILRPGGIVWVTVHTEKTWQEMTPKWPLYKALKNHHEFKKFDSSKPMPSERMVFRWREDRSYSSNIFYSFDYIKRNWGRLFDIAEIHRRHPNFQDVIVLRKT